MAYVSVKLEKRGKMPIEDFGTRVQGWPEVAACYAMTGEMDYLLRVHVEHLKHFSRFVVDQLLRQPGVVDVKSKLCPCANQGGDSVAAGAASLRCSPLDERGLAPICTT